MLEVLLTHLRIETVELNIWGVEGRKSEITDYHEVDSCYKLEFLADTGLLTRFIGTIEQILIFKFESILELHFLNL